MTPTVFTVTATNEADDELTILWIQTPALRNAITQASARADRELRFDADQKGVPHSLPGYPSARMLRIGPLSIQFTASEPDRLVTTGRNLDSRSLQPMISSTCSTGDKRGTAGRNVMNGSNGFGSQYIHPTNGSRVPLGSRRSSQTNRNL